jgi:hypothetical protein
MCAIRRKSIFFRTRHVLISTNVSIKNPMPNTGKNYISQLIAQIAIFVNNLGGHSRNSDNLQIVNETANAMLQQYQLSRF